MNTAEEPSAAMRRRRLAALSGIGWPLRSHRAWPSATRCEPTIPLDPAAMTLVDRLRKHELEVALSRGDRIPSAKTCGRHLVQVQQLCRLDRAKTARSRRLEVSQRSRCRSCRKRGCARAPEAMSAHDANNRYVATQNPKPPIARFFFADTRMAWFWLIVRLLVGSGWVAAGVSKVTGYAFGIRANGSPWWFRANDGAAVKSFATMAINHGGAQAVPGMPDWVVGARVGMDRSYSPSPCRTPACLPTWSPSARYWSVWRRSSVGSLVLRLCSDCS